MVLIAYLMRRRREGLHKVMQGVKGKRCDELVKFRIWRSYHDGRTVIVVSAGEVKRG